MKTYTKVFVVVFLTYCLLCIHNVYVFNECSLLKTIRLINLYLICKPQEKEIIIIIIIIRVLTEC